VLVVRLLVVLALNSGRVGAGELEGLRITGRYYPVEKVCPGVRKGEFDDALKADPDAERLYATGNRFVRDPPTNLVQVGCGWQNLSFDQDPQVSISMIATLYTDATTVRERFVCTPGEPPDTARTVALGRYTSCRHDDGFEVDDFVIADNAVVACSVKSRDETVLPDLAGATARECERLLDRLARSRPVSFWGNGFWTVR
jgi:hypothetical protein